MVKGTGWAWSSASNISPAPVGRTLAPGSERLLRHIQRLGPRLGPDSDQTGPIFRPPKPTRRNLGRAMLRVAASAHLAQAASVLIHITTAGWQRGRDSRSGMHRSADVGLVIGTPLIMVRGTLSD